jgi:hypothetical protein
LGAIVKAAACRRGRAAARGCSHGRSAVAEGTRRTCARSLTESRPEPEAPIAESAKFPSNQLILNGVPEGWGIKSADQTLSRK